MKPDLESIYSELDLRPNCSLAEFQRAYRKSIADLHPDRNTKRKSARTDPAKLRHLIRVYTMVSRFHRRYGRMPGGYPPHIRGSTSAGIPGRGRSPLPPVEQHERSDTHRTRTTLTLVVLFIALVAMLALWSSLATGPLR